MGCMGVMNVPHPSRFNIHAEWRVGYISAFLGPVHFDNTREEVSLPQTRSLRSLAPGIIYIPGITDRGRRSENLYPCKQASQ